MPLLKLIESVPRYAKFLKERCTISRKQKTKGAKKGSPTEHVATITEPNMPKKCSDPGMFTIPCTINGVKFPNALIDLGASINVILDSVFNEINLGGLQHTLTIIQLADRLSVRPRGVCRDILAEVDALKFPADFYV